MQQNYSKKIEPIQKATQNTASSVLDTSSQSESLQRKADMANNAAQREEAPRPNNTGMPDNLKSGIESLSGFSMDDVRVHYNSNKPATVQALAYTQGTDIHVAPGQEKHLPHEAWHVAQQMAGRVSPTTNINGMPVNDNATLEHEADVMGEKAVQRRGWKDVVEKKYDSKTVQCYSASIYYNGHEYSHPFNTLGELVSCIKLQPNVVFEDCYDADAILRELENYENYENLIITEYHRFCDIIKYGLLPFLKTHPLNAEAEDEGISGSIESFSRRRGDYCYPDTGEPHFHKFSGGCVFTNLRHKHRYVIDKNVLNRQVVDDVRAEIQGYHDGNRINDTRFNQLISYLNSLLRLRQD